MRNGCEKGFAKPPYVDLLRAIRVAFRIVVVSPYLDPGHHLWKHVFI